MPSSVYSLASHQQFQGMHVLGKCHLLVALLADWQAALLSNFVACLFLDESLDDKYALERLDEALVDKSDEVQVSLSSIGAAPLLP